MGLSLCVGTLAACSPGSEVPTSATDPTEGSTDSPNPSGTSGSSSDDGVDETGVEPEACVGPGPSSPRALTRVQYRNTIRDLFALADGPWSDPALAPWSSLQRVGPFDALPAESVQPSDFEALAAMVAAAVEPAVLLPCAPDTPDPDACAETLVTQMGRAVWRRPLTPAELEALLVSMEGVDLVEGTRSVLEVMLASPEFYVIREQGTPAPEDPDVLVLDDHSRAARLSYFLWGSTPDQTLLARADAGELGDPMVLAEEAQRLLEDTRAGSTVGELYAQWLGVRELGALVKDGAALDPGLAYAMDVELRVLAADLVLGPGDGRLETLLRAPHTFVDDTLLELYGADVLATEGTPGPNQFVRAQLDPTRRGGLMTVPGVMASHSGESSVGLTRRGQLVLEAWQCNSLPPPPDDLMMQLPSGLGRYEAEAYVLEEVACAACHQLVEGAHRAWDHLDARGRWQTEIEGQPVQTAGQLPVPPLAFSDHLDLMDQLLAQPETLTCVATQHLRFALRRELVEGDQCTIEALTERLVQTEGDLADLLVSIVTEEAFGRVRPG